MFITHFMALKPFYTRHLNKCCIVRILETLYYKDRKKKSRVMCGILELAIGLRINNRNTWSSHQQSKCDKYFNNTLNTPDYSAYQYQTLQIMFSRLENLGFAISLNQFGNKAALCVTSSQNHTYFWTNNHSVVGYPRSVLHTLTSVL